MVARPASLGLKMPQDAAVLAALLPWQRSLQHLSIQSRYLWALLSLRLRWGFSYVVVFNAFENHVRLTLLWKL